MEKNKIEKDSQEYVRRINPTQFEEHCKTVLEGMAEEEGLQNFQIYHNVKLEGHDGTYQIDVFAKYISLGTEIKILCECKQYSQPIERKEVVVLADKLYQLGCNKGILLSTSDFQSGAIRYAKEHGIALIKVYDHSLDYLSHSGGPTTEKDKDPFLMAERMMPPYRAECYYPDKDEPVLVFPTKRIIMGIYKEMNQMMKEQWGYDIPLFFDE